MVHLVREVLQVVRLRQPRGGRVDVDEQASAVAQGVCLFLQGAQHPLGGERSPDDPRGEKFVAAAPVVGQVAAVAAAESAEVALVGLLPRVRPHVGL